MVFIVRTRELTYVLIKGEDTVTISGSDVTGKGRVWEVLTLRTSLGTFPEFSAALVTAMNYLD